MSHPIPRTDEGDFKCPTCETDETNRGTRFATRGGVRSHHAQVHGESLAFDTRECRHCDEEFTSRISKNQQYCSPDCAHTHQWMRYRQAKKAANAD